MRRTHDSNRCSPDDAGDGKGGAGGARRNATHIGDAGVDGPNPALRPEEPGTIAVPGSVNLWCPRADSKTPPAGKLVTRVSTARIRRRPPQTRNGAALATPSYSLVPPGGFENSPRGKIGDAGADGPNPALRPEEPGTVVVPGSANLWCPRADSNRRHPL